MSNTVAIIVAILGFLAGGWGYLAQRKVAKENRELQKQQVEAEAFVKAREHYKDIIDELADHVKWLKSELADRTSELADRAAENEKLREQITALEKVIEALKSANVIVIEPPKSGR